MNTRTSRALLVVAALFVWSAGASAIPKAAEHPDAQVTTVADVARPKRAPVKAEKPVKRKAAKPEKKPAKRVIRH